MPQHPHPAHPSHNNNMNGFYWSVRGMGFPMGMDVQWGPGGVPWDKKYMGSMAAYEWWKNALANYPEDIEPYWKGFPLHPRLTRRWWDHEFIMANLAAAQKAAGDSQ